MVKEYDKKSKTRLGSYFVSNEFDCPCSKCSTTLIDTELVAKLNLLRQDFGAPLRITSGYRCAEYQKSLKERGYETAIGISQHELGKAVDIQPISSIPIGFPSRMLELKQLAQKLFRAVGAGMSFIHVDLRDDKERHWTYITR